MLGAVVPGTESDPDAVRHPDLGRSPRARVGDSTHRRRLRANWKPVFNVLEPARLEVVLCNAQHVKNVPGRKTDVKDAQWLATLSRVGLLRASFVPPKDIRELRDLTRYRTQVIRQRARECNRIQKLLEDGNIKSAGVATDILGKSGRDMLDALSKGADDPKQLADLAQGKMRSEIPALEEALRGVRSETQRWLLREQLAKVAELAA